MAPFFLAKCGCHNRLFSLNSFPDGLLDLGAAEQEAKRFNDFAKRPDTQIFITSHSPAFYLAENSAQRASNRRFFVSKQSFDLETKKMAPANAAAPIDTLQKAEERMQAAGLMQLPFVISRLREYQVENAALKAEQKVLSTKLQKLRKPTLFVEGKHDVALFRAALIRAGAKRQEIAVKPLDGTPNTTASLLKALTKNGGQIGQAPSFFLFDNDKSGRKAYKTISNNMPEKRPLLFIESAFAWALPQTKEFRKFLDQYDIREDLASFTAEFLFPAKESAKLCLEITQPLRSNEIKSWREQIHGDYWPKLGQIKCRKLAEAEVGSSDWLFARGVPDTAKERFARAAEERQFSTRDVDNIARIVIESLLDK